MRVFNRVKNFKKYIKLSLSLLLFSFGVFLVAPVGLEHESTIGEWVSGDKKNMLERLSLNGEVSVSEDGYTLKVDKAILNEKKLIITGSISGPELVYKNGVFPADVEIVPKDFMEKSTAEGGGTKYKGSGDTYTFILEENYKQGEVESFISKGQKYLTLDVMIYRRNESEKAAFARKFEEQDFNKRDYRVYWKESDKALKEFKSICVPFIYN
jgi:hypothetical protein